MDNYHYLFLFIILVAVATEIWYNGWQGVLYAALGITGGVGVLYLATLLYK